MTPHETIPADDQAPVDLTEFDPELAETTAEAPAAEQDADDAEADAEPAGPTFLSLGLDARVLAAVEDLGYQRPSPIQEATIPLLLDGRDVVGLAQTGTGKTKTLQMMAEQLSAAGVPVFLADVKGDLSGLATAGTASGKLTERTRATGMPWQAQAYPVEFYALGGDGIGVPVRATVDSFGPVLLSRIMELNETQESCLQLMFHWADQRNLPLDDLKDLKAVVVHLTSDEGKADLKGLGGVSTATANVILRKVTGLEASGMDQFFGVPEFETAELLRVAPDGRGVVSCLELPTLQSKPELFSTFMISLLADLFAELPEAGDLDKPKLVFFLDEAHLLFDGASRAFLEAITTTVRLIRSKGVGLFFITQTPKDVPGDVLAQLANRVQHALRAFTPDAPRLTLTEAADAAGVPRATARRSLLTLVELGYAVQDGRAFELTPKVLELGHGYWSGRSTSEVLRPVLTLSLIHI